MSAAAPPVADWLTVPPVADELGRRFAAAGHALYLVGGSVRDALLGRLPADSPDLDFTTDARPERVLELTAGWADAVWQAGIRFGTVGLTRAGTRLEVTTFRRDDYEPSSRKPEVVFGDSLAGDLHRRDFTVNAMAVSVPEHVFTDPFGGMRDLAAGVLRTPGPPGESFDDDPLRMLRAVRFVAQLGFSVEPATLAAVTSLADRLRIVSAERVRDELSKTLLGPHAVPALELLVDSGLAEVVIPELPRLRLEVDEHHRHKDVYAHSLAVLQRAIDREPAGPDLTLRLAALLHDIGKPDTRRFEPDGGVSFHHHEVVGAKLVRRRLTALAYPKALVADVERLVFLHLRFHGYGSGEWTDSAVRRYVTDAGDLLDRLHLLVRSDCTTRNKRKAAALDAAYDALEERIDRIRTEEDLRAVRPDLDGTEIGALLGIPPGPEIGAAWRHLKELRLERGPLGHDEAVAELYRWAAGRGLRPPG